MTYRLASEIFEAQDLGFNDDEVKDLVGCSDRIYGYVSENKYEIGWDIVKFLKVMYPGQNVTRPWIDIRSELKTFKIKMGL